MKHTLYFVIVTNFLLTLTLGGCGKAPPPASPTLPESGPVSVELWKTLPIEQKYDHGTLVRLRESDPALKSTNAWKKFRDEVIKPEFDREVPAISPEEARK